jgi:hypothetical protein
MGSAYELYFAGANTCACGDSGLNDAETQKMAFRAAVGDWSATSRDDEATEDGLEDEENGVCSRAITFAR